jgi:hypothetical protein
MAEAQALAITEPLYARYVLHRPPLQLALFDAPEPWSWPGSPLLPDSSAWPLLPPGQSATFPV